jgi:membrane-bound metal-dependent hydrolase YbcI (DUF457 family)
MAGFKTHVGVSTVVGIGYGTAGSLLWGVPLPAAIVSTGLCSVAGMLPDVDSDSGKPIQEVMGFAAAVVSLSVLESLRQRGLGPDSLVAVGMGAYAFVRFGLGAILRRLTVHRGMWHSLPAVAIAAMVTAFLCFDETPLNRWFKVGAVALGYLVHLLLDEIYSVRFARGRVRLKKSSGTALKVWGDSLGANLFTMANLLLLAYLLLNPPFHAPDATRVTTPSRVFPGEMQEQAFQFDLFGEQRRR